ncbi:conserved hypothetical protein [Vibrio chagasii]|nr:conserved hypothetical protein [Vibrio chagasii]
MTTQSPNTKSFTERKFMQPKTEHASLKHVNADSNDWNKPEFDWEYFGLDKYGRYAVCKNTNIKRGLTMGEFYGSSSVD